MSEDLTKKLPKNDSDMLILTAVQNLDTYVRSAIDNLVTWVSSIDSRLHHLEQKVDRLEQKVEERLYDTRPIWEKLVIDIGQLQEGQQLLQEGQQRLEEGQRRLEEGHSVLQAEVREIRTSQRDVSRRMSIFNDTLTTMQADYRDIYDRVRGLEVNRDQPNSST
jgi:chromosome segregation ATPase